APWLLPLTTVPMPFAILRNPLPSSAAALPRSVGVSRLKRLDGPIWFGLAKPPQDRPPRLPPWRRCRHRPSAARNTCCERSARSCRVHAYADLRRNEHAERGRRPDAPLSLLLTARSCPSSLEFVPHRQQLGPMFFDPKASLFQNLVWRIARQQVAVRETDLRGEVSALDMHVRRVALDMHVRRVLIVEEHQELEAAKPLD